MYNAFETSLSKKYLKEIFRESSGALLLGGWAVYLLVDPDFREATGRGYIGSRDIDIGFHLEEGSGREDLEASKFSQAFRRLRSLGFHGQSFRMYKDFDAEDHRELQLDEAESKLPFELNRLYVDLVVDTIPKPFREVFGFTPIDEPLLEEAFRSRRFRQVSWEGVTLDIVEPSLLLGMKLNSVLTRTRDHKRLKDVADIYALAWHSGEDLTDLKKELRLLIPTENLRDIIKGIGPEDLSAASDIIGIEARTMSRVFSELNRRT